MKCLILLVFCAISVYGISEELQQKAKAKLMEAAAVCVPESGANEDDIAELMDRKLPSRKEGKCLVACFHKKFGLQGEDGKPDKEGTLKFLEPIHDDDPETYNKLIQIAITCGPKVSEMPITDPCDIAFEIYQCVCHMRKELGLDDPFNFSG